MEYGVVDSSGTDDDLPPSHQNMGVRGLRITGNGRSAGAPPYTRVQNSMENQIHRLEQEAYSSVLLAFKAQSDAISWDKESLITNLRKELRVSNEEHRELLNKVNADDIIHRIREWRQDGGLQSSMVNNTQNTHDSAHSPTVSASRKRQKTSLSLRAPSPALHSQGVSTSIPPPTTTGKLGVAAGSKGKKSGQIMSRVTSVKSLQYPATGPSGRGQVTNRTSGALAAAEPAEPAAYDPLIGRKVMTRWPADNNFYEAVITNYKAHEGLHALVYDIHTDNETWEWVNLKEIPREDIRWDGEDPGISNKADRGVLGRGNNKSLGRGGGGFRGQGRGRGGSLTNQSNKDFVASQNGIEKKGRDNIELLHTETLIKEVERVFGATHPDPLEMEKARKVLKDHEKSLINAIERLAYASDGESERGDDHLPHGRSMDEGRGRRRLDYTEPSWS